MINSWRVLLKLCFQVFIILSLVNEAGSCRVYERAWDNTVLIVWSVKFSDLCSRSISLFAIVYWCRALIVYSLAWNWSELAPHPCPVFSHHYAWWICLRADTKDCLYQSTRPRSSSAHSTCRSERWSALLTLLPHRNRNNSFQQLWGCVDTCSVVSTGSFRTLLLRLSECCSAC